MQTFTWLSGHDAQMALWFWIISAILLLLLVILWFASQKAATWYPPLVLAPAAGGMLVGYTVGLSDTPIVATFVPLLFGLLGAIGYAEARKRSFTSEFSQKLDGMAAELQADSLAKLKDLAKVSEAEQDYLPALAGLGTCVFFIFCFFGITKGIEQRVPSYKAMHSLVQASSPLTPDEVMAIANTTWALRHREIPVEEHDQILTYILKPTLEKTEGREEELIRIAALVRKSSTEAGKIVPVPGPPQGTTPFLKSVETTDAIAGIDNRIERQALTYEEAYTKLKQVLLKDLVGNSHDHSSMTRARMVTEKMSMIDSDLLSGERSLDDFKTAYDELKATIVSNSEK